MKSLIITGAQQTGKSMLAMWLQAIMHESIYVHDGVTREYILRTLNRCAGPEVFTTNDEVTYHDVDPERFMIIKLDNIPFTLHEYYIVTRTVTIEECKWFERDIKAGERLYPYYDFTYGTVSKDYVAVTMRKGEMPFFSFPKNAVN